MRSAEASLRTLGAYLGVLRGRVALARVSRRRAEFERVSDSDLALLVLECEKASELIDAILRRISPELARSAAAIADVDHQQAFTEPRPPAAAHLRLVDAERSGCVTGSRS